MKKRLFSLVLAALFIVMAVPITTVADDTDVEVDINNQYITRFDVDTVYVSNDDETVEVNINVNVNSGFAAMTYQLVYDSDALLLEQQPKLGDIEGLELVPGPINVGKHVGQLFAVENVYESGVLLTYTFRIKPEAKTGTHEIKFITDGSAEVSGNIQALEVLDENFFSVANVSTSGGVVIPGYTVSYDANGGSGAPATQTKSKNDFVYISSVVPTRGGYKFLGWATEKDALKAEYTAGDKYSENANLTLYAVWEKLEVIAGSIDLTVATVEGKAGDEVEVAVSVANHLGVNGLEFDIVFDNTKLSYVSAELVEHEDAEITLDKFMFVPPNADTVTNKLRIGLVANVQNLLGDGDVVKIKFKVLDTAEDGLTEISLVPSEAFCLYGPYMEVAKLTTNITNGGVEISSQLLGDIDLDEDVDIDDAVLLFQYSMVPDVYPIGYKGNVDFTNDGEVGIDDAILLFQYSMLPDVYPIG